MKKAAVFLLAVGLLLWGIYMKLGKTEKYPSDKYIGKVSVTLYEDKTPIKGRVTVRCYQDRQELYEQPDMKTFTDTMPRFTQSAAEFTTTATGTSTTVTTTVATATDASTTTTAPTAGNRSELEITYNGELLEDPVYTVYDDAFKEVVKPRADLRLPEEKGLYYVKINATWGKKKNYTKLDYFFIIEVVD